MTQHHENTRPAVADDFLERRLSAIAPDEMVHAEDRETMCEPATTCESTISSDTGIQALLELAHHVRSPQAIDFVARIRRRLGGSEVSLTGDEVRFLLKLALHVKRRKPKSPVHKRLNGEKPDEGNGDLAGDWATRTTW